MRFIMMACPFLLSARRVIAAVLLGSLAGCASASPAPVCPAPPAAEHAAHAGKTDFFLGNAREAIAASPLGAEEKLKLAPFFENADHTVNLIQTRGAVPPHYHAEHDEVVLILEGGGTFMIEGKAREVKAGDVQVIPRGAVHSFVHAGDGITAVVSMFSPRFDPKDRILVKPVSP